MQRATAFALAFVNASAKASDKHWVARTVQDRVDHTRVGIKVEPDVRVHVSNKTRLNIALEQRVIV